MAGEGGSIKWGGLEDIFGKWGAVLSKIGISALTVLILVFLLTCCIVPILKRWCMRAMDEKLNLAADIQGAKMPSMMPPEQMVRRILLTQRGEGIPDLFPTPDYMKDKDISDDEDEP